MGQVETFLRLRLIIFVAVMNLLPVWLIQNSNKCDGVINVKCYLIWSNFTRLILIICWWITQTIKTTVVLFKIKHTQAKINLQTQKLFKNQQFFNPYKNKTSKFKLMQKHHFTKQDQTITIHVIIN